MERFSRVTEGSDPSGTETGLEEPMLHLGLGGGGGGDGDSDSGGGGGGGGTDSYPERPDEPDCIYYLRTGFCGYGVRCRFNHPADRVAVMAAARAGVGEYPERVGQPVCQYYMRTGACKFGASCKYHHPRQGGGSVIPVTPNYYGYPFRPGEKECSYYVKTGECKFGATCKFHHPQPADIQVPTPPLAPQLAPPPVPGPAVYPTMQSQPVPNSQQYGVVMARPHLLQSSYVQGPYGPMLLSPGMVPIPGWSPYPQPGSPVSSPTTQPVVGPSSMYGMTQLSPSAAAYTQAYQQVPSPAGPSSIITQKEPPFPERPGQPECQFYMKTGDCKFGVSCRYHHPSDPTAPKQNFLLSPIGLPLRPGAQPCSHYAQRGVCKFGPACKFDHPIGGGALIYSPSASSLADMPVAPYPMGSSIATLAPSSSSSDLRPESIPGPTRMSSSVGTPSGSVGPIVAKNAVPNSSEQKQTGPSTATAKTEANQAKEV
ncbi:hypothetical protein ACFE04_007431 [Oxalis oulophora]